jgi:hypothetical protein
MGMWGSGSSMPSFRPYFAEGRIFEATDHRPCRGDMSYAVSAQKNHGCFGGKVVRRLRKKMNPPRRSFSARL